MDKKRYIILIALIVALFLICFSSMFAFMYSLYRKSPTVIWAVLSALSFAAIIVITIIFRTPMTAYEKKRCCDKLSKREFTQAPTAVTYESIRDFLLKKGFRQSSENPDIYRRTYKEDIGDGALTCFQEILVSKYEKSMGISSPIKEKSFLSTTTYLWIIFVEELTDDILAQFKNYELNELKRMDHKAFHRCGYYPVVLIHKGTAYYLSGSKSAAKMFLRLTKEK